MDSHFPHGTPHQPHVSSFDHQHNKGHVPHYAQAGHRQVAIIKPSQRQPAPCPDFSMANPDRAGHGWHQRFQWSLRNTSSLQPRGYYLQRDNTPLINEGFKSLRQNPQQAINIAEAILAQGDNLSLPDTQNANLIKVRALFQSGCFDDCQKIFETLAQGQTPLNNGLRMAKGRVLQATFRLTEALPIFQDLYHRSTSEKAIKVNGLALGRQYQDMGQHQKALTSFKTLRTNRSGHEGTPCNDKEVELALGDIYVDLMNWLKFDQMQLDDRGFTGPEVDLCISIRYFKECISSCQDKDISGLLTKAINHACDAIEKSQHLDASSFSQLGHSIRIAASLPIGKAPDTFPKDELNKLSSIFFTEANKLAPNRQDRLKNEDWRNRERDFLARLSSG